MSILKKIILVLFLAFSVPVFSADLIPKDKCENGVCKIPKEDIRAEVIDLPTIRKTKDIESPAAVPAPIYNLVVSNAKEQTFLDKLLNSNVFLSFIIGLAVLIYQVICKKFNIDPVNFEGLLIHCFNEVENLGVLKNWDGNQKLTEAMKLFDDRFRATYGGKPTDQQKEFAKFGFAKVAFTHKISKPTAILDEETKSMLLNLNTRFLQSQGK